MNELKWGTRLTWLHNFEGNEVPTTNIYIYLRYSHQYVFSQPKDRIHMVFISIFMFH